MQYIGNKQSLVSTIHELMKKHNIEGDTFCDVFAGTHSVGNYFKEQGFTVHSNDWQHYSYIFGKALIENTEVPKFETLLHSDFGQEILKANEETLVEPTNYEKVLGYLNSLEGIEGFFYFNYCPGGTVDQEHQRMYFSDENGKKFDQIRTLIQEWKNTNLVNEMEFYILLGSLMKAMDAVSNTTSVYGAFLKKIKGAAARPMKLKPMELNLKGDNHKAYCNDANLIVDTVEADIFYLDPPYNARQYSSNYHVLETMALYDNPELKGKTGLRNYDHQKSPYSSKQKVKMALRDLVKRINGKYILLSYNDEGILSHEDIMEVLSIRGKVHKEEIEYRRFKSDKNGENRQYKRDDNKVYELLYIVKITN